jgi:hypothetical protein
MIEKIISGGQTGADQAALDAAIKLNIPHGGWISKGRITENGTLPDKYNLIEMPTHSYAERTKKNIIEADGTLILSHGDLSGGSEYTKMMAERCDKKFLCIDFNKTDVFNAAHEINDWIVKNDIKILNVAGARASRDPSMYEKIKGILQAVFFLNLTESNMFRSPTHASKLWQDEDHPTDMPKSVDEVVEDILAEMDLRDKFLIAHINRENLAPLELGLGRYIKEQLKVWSVNEELKESCIQVCKEEGLDESNPAMAIIVKIWKKLKQSHKLRIVK